jgi:hypothetical protein
MERQERLKEVMEFINTHGRSEMHFGELYGKLLEEYNHEWAYNSDMQTNHYLNNLRQTRDKQAMVYQETKRRRLKKGAPTEFSDFVSNFRHDVMQATHR